MPKPAYLLDANIVSGLVRRPAGRIRDCIGACGEEWVFTSIIVAAELRFGAAKKGSERLSAQLEIMLSALGPFRGQGTWALGHLGTWALGHVGT